MDAFQCGPLGMAPSPLSKRLRMRTAFLFLSLLLTTAAALMTGCAMTGEDESDMPWNTPESWEGSPMIPGLGDQ